MNEEGQDVVVVEENQTLPALLSQDQVLMSVHRAKERVEAFVLIKQYALKATNKNDWSNIGDKPYLEDTGSEKIAGLFAPEIGKPVISKEVFSDGHYMYTCDGIASWGGKTIPVMGTRSTRDKFFIEYDYETVEGKRQKIELSTEELLLRISAGNVRKSALTNYRNNAIKDVLGLEGITWEELFEFAGIKKEDVTGYTFNQQEMSGDAKDKAKDTEKMLVEMYGNDYAAQLVKLTENTDNSGKKWPGIKTLTGCSEKKLPIVHRQVKKEYDTWKKANGKQGQKQSGDVLLGTQSPEYQNMKVAMDKATDMDRLNNLLGELSATFNQAATRGLTAYAKSREKALDGDVQS